MNTYIILLILLIFVILLYMIYMNYKMNTDKNIIEKGLYKIQNFLVDENARINFTNNNINITGKFETNLKIVLFDYLTVQGFFEKYNMEHEVVGIFSQTEITTKDLYEIFHILQMTTSRFDSYNNGDLS